MRLRRSAVPVAAACLVLLSACGEEGSSSSDESAGSGSDDATTGECEWVPSAQPAAAEVDPPAPDATPATAVVLTIAGADVEIELNPDAPCAATSFTSLAEQGYFDGAPCSRVSDPAQAPYGILQCGDPTGTGTGRPGYSFADELSGDESYPEGSVAMANSGPDSNGSQFFLNFADSQFPPSYTVLGTMSPESLEALRSVVSSGAEGGVPDGPPAEPAVIESARPVE